MVSSTHLPTCFSFQLWAWSQYLLAKSRDTTKNVVVSGTGLIPILHAFFINIIFNALLDLYCIFEQNKIKCITVNAKIQQTKV